MIHAAEVENLQHFDERRLFEENGLRRHCRFVFQNEGIGDKGIFIELDRVGRIGDSVGEGLFRRIISFRNEGTVALLDEVGGVDAIGGIEHGDDVVIADFAQLDDVLFVRLSRAGENGEVCRIFQLAQIDANEYGVLVGAEDVRLSRCGKVENFLIRAADRDVVEIFKAEGVGRDDEVPAKGVELGTRIGNGVGASGVAAAEHCAVR